jgi:hypothetical protein
MAGGEGYESGRARQALGRIVEDGNRAGEVIGGIRSSAASEVMLGGGLLTLAF